MKALEEKRCVEAVNHFQTALTLVPSFKNRLAKPFAQALQCQAASLPDQKSKEVEALLQKSVELNSESIEGYHRLGLLYYNRKKADPAKSEAE